MKERTGAPVLERHARLPSTQDRIRELAREGAPFGTTVLADCQTAGRGRGGKRWVSRPGTGIWVSVLLPGPGSRGLQGLPLAIGASVALALEDRFGGRLALKWPNDLFRESTEESTERRFSKLGGILCESASRGAGGGKAGVAVGVGINLRRSEMGVDGESDGELDDPSPVGTVLQGEGEQGTPPAGYLEEWVGRPLDDDEVAEVVIRSILPSGDGDPVRLDARLHRAVRDRDLLRGRRVTVSTGPTGTAVGIREDGALLIRTDAGVDEVVWSGSVRIADHRHAGSQESQWNRGNDARTD